MRTVITALRAQQDRKKAEADDLTSRLNGAHESARQLQKDLADNAVERAELAQAIEALEEASKAKPTATPDTATTGTEETTTDTTDHSK